MCELWEWWNLIWVCEFAMQLALVIMCVSMSGKDWQIVADE